MTAFPKGFREIKGGINGGHWINLNQIVEIRKYPPNPHGDMDNTRRWHEDYLYIARMSNGDEILIFSTLDKEKALNFEDEIMGFEL